jgi:hypothetical protein
VFGGGEMKKLLIVCAVLLVLPHMVSAWPIPDTGQTKCYTNGPHEINPCPLPGEPFYGQDANHGSNTQFYTKLDANGDDLPFSATEWVMVRDDVTGLIWEVKTDDGSMHDKDDTYTWQDAQDVFIANLNSQQYGGNDDWRLPMVKELFSILNRNSCNPTIDVNYFPNTANQVPSHPNHYWSSQTVIPYPDNAWIVVFSHGSVNENYNKAEEYYVRAVRGEFPVAHLVDNRDGTITDRSTGLMWQQDREITYPVSYWGDALAYCENLTLAGYSDWRLPNINELQSIVDYNHFSPAIDINFFPNTGGYRYESSTTYNHCGNTTDSKWFVGFLWGDVYRNYKYNGGAVRAVRGGLCGTSGDSDGDTVCNDTDNCIDDYNPSQSDCDEDGTGDACDEDTIDNDGDGIDDGEGEGHGCDECIDMDADGYGNPGFSNNCDEDNCPDTYNPSQEDTDDSGIGDACNDSIDSDDDEWEDVYDNCPATPNTDQEDTYPPGGNAIGDACDCEGDLNCDGNVDAGDVTAFLTDFARGHFFDPCENGNPCNGDINCDANVDALDIPKFLEDLGRNQFNNPCPSCVAGPWCVYP